MLNLLKNTANSHTLLKQENTHEKYLVWSLLLLYTAVNLIFGFNEDATWDDDCPTRYYNTLNAFNEPHHFISVWNRPLFVLVFAPIVHLGRNSIFISMVIITAIAAYYLYKGVKKTGAGNAYMIIPFLLFQTYFFSISRNAETEPLSVALLCFGFYFLTHKKWFWFALMGGLVPLARLELSVLLIFWAWYLFKERQYFYIFILGLPTVLWNVAGGIINDDFMYVINQTIGKENSSNRYGHTDFNHYFLRYIYVVGPVIYLFFIVGLIEKIRQFKLDLFVFWQMVIGFMLYVVFSWKLNMGNSAGFLRNLIPLAPLTALLALDGFNTIWDAFLSGSYKSKQFNAPKKDFEEFSDEEIQQLSTKQRKILLAKMDAYDEKLAQVEKVNKSAAVKQKKNSTNQVIWMFLIVGLVALTTFLYHSQEIKSHHKLTENKDYTNLITLGIVILGIGIWYVFTRAKEHKPIKITLIGLLFGVMAFGFTAITEPPDNNMSPERRVMQDVAEFYVNSYLKEHTTYVNHIWFFWAKDLNKYDTIHYKKVTQANLNAANRGDVLIYETHYSHRLDGDVPTTWFENRLDWVELSRKIASDKSFQCVIYQKTDSTHLDAMAKLNKYITTYPNDYMSYFSRGNLYKAQQKIDSALIDYNKVISIDSSFFNIFYSRGLVYFDMKEYELALSDFKKSLELNEKSNDAAHNIGACYANLSAPDSALVYFNKAAIINPKHESAFINKARLLKGQQKLDEAIEALGKAISINGKNDNTILERAQIYYEKQDWTMCILDLTNVLKINPKNDNAALIRGICYQNINEPALACQDWLYSAQFGNQQAIQFTQVYCK
jgi:tetratricopeptide (TPR) repeat protein